MNMNWTTQQLIQEVRRREQLEAALTACIQKAKNSEFEYLQSMHYFCKSLALLTHELSQPLSVINAYASGCMRLMQKQPCINTPFLKPLDKILQQLSKTHDIIHKIRNIIC